MKPLLLKMQRLIAQTQPKLKPDWVVVVVLISFKLKKKSFLSKKWHKNRTFILHEFSE